MSIRGYFDEIKLRLVLDPTVESFEVISEKIKEKEEYLRVTIKLSGDSVMHCFRICAIRWIDWNFKIQFSLA